MPRYPDIQRPPNKREYVVIIYGLSTDGNKPRSIGRSEPFVATKYQANLYLMEMLQEAFSGIDKAIVGGAVLEIVRK